MESERLISTTGVNWYLPGVSKIAETEIRCPLYSRLAKTNHRSNRANVNRIGVCQKGDSSGRALRSASKPDLVIALSYRADYDLRLYLILTIPLDQYDSFVKQIDIASPAYEVLRKGVFERQTRGDHYERIMNVMCNGWEAEMLLDLANNVCPDIAPGIAKHIARAHSDRAVR